MPVAPGHKHAATGDADCATIAASTIVSGETKPIGSESIQMRRLYVFVAVGSDRVRALIVGKEENDIRSGEQTECWQR